MSKPHKQQCPLARMLNLFGDHWSWLIIRECFYGATRFSTFQRNTGIAKNLLTDRLAMLVREGILEKKNIGDRGTRFAYELTDKGRELETVMIAMFQWGNTHLFDGEAPPISIVDKLNHEPLQQLKLTAQDGRKLTMQDLAVLPGTSARSSTRRRLSEIPGNAPAISTPFKD